MFSPLQVGYVPRIVDAELSAMLAANGAVVVEGPKACGKTETARQQSASEVLLDIDANAQQAVAVDPALILPGDRPRLLDEWQTHPALWNHVRRSVDAERQPGMYVLTGSAVPADDATRHTGAGRFGRLRMHPFELLFESLVVRDLRVYAQACDATVSHYRDSSGLEVDAIVTTDTGAWIAVEVELGSSAEVLDAAAANLRKLAGRVDTAKRGEPAALAIVVGTGYGYVRPDGVHVIPIGTLAP